jgi:hypothetical protein
MPAMSLLMSVGRVVEIHPDLLCRAGAVKREFLVRVGEHAAGEHDVHHMVVEVGHLGPPLPHIAAKEPEMAGAGENGIGVIVDHHAVEPPQHDHGHWRLQDNRSRGLEALGPGADRAQ